MLTNMYPKCAQSFKNWCLSRYKFGKMYNDLGKPKPFDVYLSSLELSNVDFKYDDFRKGYSDFGMDYDHIDLDKVNLQITQFNNLKGEFNFVVKKLNTKERCGFKLNSLEMGVNISPKGLKIKNLHIQTP